MSTELSPKAAEIITHTRSLLQTGGYNSFSYADISTLVKISKASIHHHFPSKAELVRVVVAQYRDEARQGMYMLDQHLADPAAELHAYVDYWSKCIEENIAPFCICALLAMELPVLPEAIANEIRGHFQDLTDWLTSLLEQGQSKGIFQLQDTPAVEAKSFMATVHGAMLAARSFGDPQIFRTLVQIPIQRLTSL